MSEVYVALELQSLIPGLHGMHVVPELPISGST